MRILRIVALILAAIGMIGPARASTLTVLYRDDTGGGSGNLGTPLPVAGGAVIGTARGGGAHGWGQVFLLTPGATPASPWTKTVLHDFLGGTTDGAAPDNLMVDGNGDVWGVAGGGGANTNGTIFELLPPSAPGGSWTYRRALPMPLWLGGQATSRGYSTLLDPSGNLWGLMTMGAYGTGCETSGCGLIFNMPAATLAGTSRMRKTLYTFSAASVANGGFGGWPQGLARDAHGNLYGVEYSGGDTFNPNTGYGPLGVVWQVSPGATAGAWTGSVIYTFCEANYLSGDCADGEGPTAVAVDPQLGLLGTTEYAGGSLGNAYGVVYRLQKIAGTWVYTLVHTLYSQQTTPDYLVRKPLNMPIRSRSGDIVTTLDSGGAANLGSVRARSGGVLAVNPRTGGDANLSAGFATSDENGYRGISGPWLANTPVREGAAGVFYGASQNYYDATTNTIGLPGVIYQIVW